MSRFEAIFGTSPRPIVRSVVLAALLMVGSSACDEQEDRTDFAARLGNRVITQQDIDGTLSAVGPGLLDTTEAATRIVEQWITDELLYEEGVSRGLRQRESVQRQLEESERSVVVAALLAEIYDEADAQPSESDIEAYFETNKDELRLLEPYVRVLAIETESADSASAAAAALRALDLSDADSWEALLDRWSEDPEVSRGLSGNYVPESRIFRSLDPVGEAILDLGIGRVATVQAYEGRFYAILLVDRIPAGTTPRLEWVRESLRQRLAIESRKQLYARLVQRLRNEALAGESLEIR